MQPAVRIHRTLLSPDQREKVELFGPHGGTYGFRLWERRRKAWRQALEVRDIGTYARAVYEAGRRIEWLGQVLTPEGDSRISYHLELLRGHTFQFETYSEEKFGDHDHCFACWAKFCDADIPNVLHQGYVTRYSIPDYSGDPQWKWICEKCFADLQVEMQWLMGS